MRRGATLVGWAIRALTPVFDGLWALAVPFHIGKACRAPCSPSASMLDAPLLVGTAHEKPFVVEEQCHRLCPPYNSACCEHAVTAPPRAARVRPPRVQLRCRQLQPAMPRHRVDRARA